MRPGYLAPRPGSSCEDRAGSGTGANRAHRDISKAGIATSEADFECRAVELSCRICVVGAGDTGPENGCSHRTRPIESGGPGAGERVNTFDIPHSMFAILRVAKGVRLPVSAYTKKAAS